VDDLDLAVAGEGLGVGREAGGVPAVVAGVLAVEVRGRVGEGAQEAARRYQVGEKGEKERKLKKRMKLFLIENGKRREGAAR
jgi:hypothetical protein